MSPVRTHFWMLVARGYGAGTSSRKYGLNCTIPALTNNRFGSSRISDALGTLVCPEPAKCSRNRLLISCVSTGGASCLGKPPDGGCVVRVGGVPNDGGVHGGPNARAGRAALRA